MPREKVYRPFLQASVIIVLLGCGIAHPASGPSDDPPKGKNSASSRKTSPTTPIRPAEIGAVSTDAPPKIDGVLEDACWKTPPLPLTEWQTYNPLHGEKLTQTTQVWIAYDNGHLYFAFRCLDPEPEKIKTSISRRDALFNDDWVGLSLDSLGNHQSSYDMFVNPSGIQADILTSSTSGENLAPDWVWESAGRVTERGYDVEIRLPLRSIRFRSGKDVRMGILFWRRVSRLGMSASWPDIPPGQWVFTRHASLLFPDLKHPLTLEAIPYLTYSLNRIRAAPDRWNNADSQPDVGLTVKYGITSSVTLDGTINPDFSQVESDSYQVEVNQRYPIFYSEKRPFFMEGMGTFELAGTSGDSNMRTAVHTRRIIDPLYGFKLSGTLGKVTFAALSAGDEAPGRLPESDPDSGRQESFNIARVFYSVGRASYIGGLFADTEFGDAHNRVAAADVSLRIGEHQQWSATVIGSHTRRTGETELKTGMAGQTTYGYGSKRYDFFTQLEHYDKDFEMDTSFYNRTGVTTGWVYSGMSFYPDAKKYGWFKRFVPFVFAQGGKDRVQGGNEQFTLGGVRMHFTRQGFLRVDSGGGREVWAGRIFNTRTSRVIASAQLARWLNVFTQLRYSRSIYYESQDPFLGNQRSLSLGVSFQPNQKLNQNVSYDHVGFDRLSTGAKVYSVDIVNTRTTYQFDKHFFLRAIAQYDSSRKRVLTDFLASFELVPGTVAYLGYGSLFEKRAWDAIEPIAGSPGYLNTRRGFFFKASYLHRF